MSDGPRTPGNSRESAAAEHESLRRTPFMSFSGADYYVAVDAHSPDNATEARVLAMREMGYFEPDDEDGEGEPWVDLCIEPVWLYYITPEQAREKIDAGADDIPDDACECGGWIEGGTPNEDYPFYKVGEK